MRRTTAPIGALLLITWTATSVRTQTPATVVDLVAGADTTIALRVDGTHRAFGAGTPLGQVNLPLVVPTAPHALVGAGPLVEAVLTSFQTLARRADGTVWSLGTTWAGGGPLPPGTAGSPAFAVPGITDAVQVAAGSSHGLALRSDGTVLAFGNDSVGQTGQGSTTFLLATPTPVPGLSGVTAIAAGNLFSLALMADGTVRSWGNGLGGSLGLGTIGPAVPVPTPIPGLSGVSAIGAAESTAWALMADGTVRAWGSNQFGQVDPSASPIVTSPTPIAGLAGVQQVDSGGTHFLARLADGSVVAWGRNLDGSLGIPGAPLFGNPPTPLALPAPAIDVAAGNAHSLALLVTGEVLAWGSTNRGQTALPTLQAVATPTPVMGLDSGADVLYAGLPCPLGTSASPVLSALGPPNLGNGAFALRVVRGGASPITAWVYAAAALAPVAVPVGLEGCPLLLDPTSLVSLVNAGASPIGPLPIVGANADALAPLPIPGSAPLAGLSLSLQAVALRSIGGSIALSNAMTLTLD